MYSGFDQQSMTTTAKNMKVTKAQAQANRARIVETASELFRERGYDGVGVADLMAAAGFTHGGFYRQFGSKTDLMAESAVCGISQTAALTETLDLPTFVEHYISRKHRDARSKGCTMAALSGDAARQPDIVKAKFAEGIEGLVTQLTGKPSDCTKADGAPSRADVLNALAQAVGAIALSRACPEDSALSDEILSICREKLLASLQTSS